MPATTLESEDWHRNPCGPSGGCRRRCRKPLEQIGNSPSSRSGLLTEQKYLLGWAKDIVTQSFRHSTGPKCECRATCRCSSPPPVGLEQGQRGVHCRCMCDRDARRHRPLLQQIIRNSRSTGQPSSALRRGKALLCVKPRLLVVELHLGIILESKRHRLDLTHPITDIV